MNIREVASQASELFVLPDSVVRLKECMDDEAASINDVGQIISCDPALAAQMLKVANSALYRFPHKIDSINKALQVIGTRAAYDLALAYGVSNAFGEVESRCIDLDKFWEQSVSCGLLAKYIGETKRAPEPERLFVCGLLHNIGELVVVSLLPDLAKKCQNFSISVSPAELQQALLGFTYAELSAMLIESWQIPESIYIPITQLHFTDMPNATLDIQIVQLAYVLALDNVNPKIYPSYYHLQPQMHEGLDLEQNDLEEALDITNLQCISVMSLFNPNSHLLY